MGMFYAHNRVCRSACFGVRLSSYAHLPCLLLVANRHVCRLALEAESAALGGALQAAAVHSGASVASYVQEHQPPILEQVLLVQC